MVLVDGEAEDGRSSFERTPLSRQEYVSALVHLYRGEMHRAITWRQRLDTTTNWAVFTTGTLLSFLFTQREHDYHVVGILGMYLVFFMLCYEARRFRYFDVWRNRVRKFEENFYAPLLRRDLSSQVENWGFLVAEDLLTPRFKMSFLSALRARLIRNYVPIFLILTAAWVTKLLLHPKVSAETGEAVTVESIADALAGAGVGPLPPWLVVGTVVALCVFLAAVAVFCRPRQESDSAWWSNRNDESVDEFS